MVLLPAAHLNSGLWRNAGRLRHVLESRFDELFEPTPSGYQFRWITSGHEVLITWEPRQQ